MRGLVVSDRTRKSELEEFFLQVIDFDANFEFKIARIDATFC